MSHNVVQHRRHSKDTRRTVLQVEQLEDRSLPSSTGINYQVLATLGDPLPGAAGGTFVNDFEPGGLNNHGDSAFGADVSTGGEGVFLRHHGQITELARTGGTAPGGVGTYDFGFLGPVDLNDPGDEIYVFLLTPFTSPVGVNSGAFRYSHTTGTLTPVVIPYVTPAPGGGAFQGAFFNPTINNRGDVAFSGIVQTDQGVHVPGEDYIGLGAGVFLADAKGHITNVVSPGDTAPGGGKFDYAVEPWVNDGGDVAFVGHVAGEPSVVAGFPPQAVQISALGSLYVKEASGTIRSVVHTGSPAPGGGIFHQVFHVVMNNQGQIVFDGDLTPAPDANQSIGVFLYAGGKTSAVARPGDLMPGGGHLVNASVVGGNLHLNNRGDVVFSATLDTDVDGDGLQDTGLFQWSNGRLSVIARSGMALPGIGTIFQLAATQVVIPPPPISSPTSGAINNDAGQVMFEATLTNNEVVFLLATPRGKGNSDVPVVTATAAAPPQAGADLSRVAVALMRSDQNTSRPAEVRPTSQPANPGATAGNGLAVVLPPQAPSSPATASSSAANTAHHSAVDDFFATFPEGYGDDPLGVEKERWG